MCMFTERTQVLLTPAQRRRLQRIAEERRMSVGALIRDAVDAYLVPTTRSRSEALADLCALEAPVSEWETMKADILRGATG